MIDYRVLAEAYLEAHRLRKRITEIEGTLKEALDRGDVDTIAARLEKRDKLHQQYAAAVLNAHRLSGWCPCATLEEAMKHNEKELMQ